jgi:competence ComEA-like helix-hairpin-helix protein
MQWVAVGLCTLSLFSGGLVFAQSKPGPDTGMSKPATMPDPGKAGAGAGMEKSKMAPAMEAPKAGLVDLNTADEATLTSLKGVGSVKAKAIMQYRQEHGGFKSVDELKNVTGFGDKTLESLKPLVTVGKMGQ